MSSFYKLYPQGNAGLFCPQYNVKLCNSDSLDDWLPKALTSRLFAHTKGGMKKGFYTIHTAVHTNVLFGRCSYIIYMCVPVCSLMAFSHTKFIKLGQFKPINEVPKNYLKY